MAYIEFNPNPSHKRIGDCTVRAVCKALECGWDNAFLNLCVVALHEHDMPSANTVWGALLERNGYKKFNICPDCATVSEFVATRPHGTYVIACENDHVVTAVDGDYYDTWDSGDCVIIYYFLREEV